MNKPTVPDLKELFKQAAEIAQQVPENMQQAAFNRAVDLLTGCAAPESNPMVRAASGKAQVIRGPEVKPQPEANAAVQTLVAAIDSTQHPGVTSSKKVLDRSLMVLQIALSEHRVDGLTPAEIAELLTSKFRCATTRAAVGMALGKATALVNRVSRGTGYAYRIMGLGEEYLAHLQKEPSGSRARAIPLRHKKIAERPVATGEETTSTPIDSASVARTHARGRTAVKARAASSKQSGPKAAVVALIDAGFFSTPRTGPELQNYLKTKRGFDFGINQLRLALLRLVRDVVLERDENADGDYAYHTPKA